MMIVQNKKIMLKKNVKPTKKKKKIEGDCVCDHTDKFE